jgi:ribosomal protein L23
MKLALKLENIAQLVFHVRREKVMLAQHLAELYGVRVRVLNQAIKKNKAVPSRLYVPTHKEGV